MKKNYSQNLNNREAIGEVQGQYLQQRVYEQIPAFYRSEGECLGGISLPVCTVNNLLEIKEKMSSVSPTHREAYSNIIMENDADYMKRLLVLFSDLEDLEDVEGLSR